MRALDFEHVIYPEAHAVETGIVRVKWTKDFNYCNSDNDNQKKLI